MHAARDVETEIIKRPTDMGEDSRCYSFDENPSVGIRPSTLGQEIGESRFVNKVSTAVCSVCVVSAAFCSLSCSFVDV